ncbi:hypothetical protein pb186bvf_019332 [Paramecium bursaria]
MIQQQNYSLASKLFLSKHTRNIPIRYLSLDIPRSVEKRNKKLIQSFDSQISREQQERIKTYHFKKPDVGKYQPKYNLLFTNTPMVKFSQTKRDENKDSFRQQLDLSTPTKNVRPSIDFSLQTPRTNIFNVSIHEKRFSESYRYKDRMYTLVNMDKQVYRKDLFQTTPDRSYDIKFKDKALKILKFSKYIERKFKYENMPEFQSERLPQGKSTIDFTKMTPRKRINTESKN